ncbi:LysR substrate-binding domain-containing protein [Pseudomonas sp. NPDC007930]|uniref:LysR family transcriptional regulator n=1 Tax=Pseudomonas sp. NPDC007930 TaxID=3364417 RepID=UPI0036EB6181
MDRLATLELFTRIVESASFSRAAAGLSIPRATATHAIKQLESHLATRLLERTTRHVRPTPEGQAFYERCVFILGELAEAEGSLRNLASNPSGALRVDLSSTQAARIVLPHIDDFHRRYPRVALTISCSDRLVDLVGEGIDLVIRAGVPRDSTLIARPLAQMPQVVCASPAYLAAHGTPQRPEDLAEHQAVRFVAASGQLEYPFELWVEGELKRFPAKGWMAVNDAESYGVCALRGCGLVQMPRYHVEDDLRAGRLVEVLSGWASPAMPVTALYPYRKQLSARVRVFVEWVQGVYGLRFG